MKKTLTWGNLPDTNTVKKIKFEKDLLKSVSGTVLTYGNGRSYGDVCLNETIIETDGLDKFIQIDQQKNLLICSSNLTLKEILIEIIPKGYFLPVVPGTKNITIGGAIANDIHGKNHHSAGSFGNFVKNIKIYRSDFGVIDCNYDENKSLFTSTIGGLGLTGVILSATIELKKINSSYINQITKRFNSFSEFLDITNQLEKSHEHCVGWVDLANTNNFRGLVLAGNHSNYQHKNSEKKIKLNTIQFPFTLPFSLVNKLTIGILNKLYFFANKSEKSKISNFNSFFFPLDKIEFWNKAYGKKGFYQYQFVIPNNNAETFFKELTSLINASKELPALTVLKRFGNIKSKGAMSFPREGITLAIDFPNKGTKTLELLNKLDELVLSYNGALYPAKDSRMPKTVFEKSFPNIDKFKKDLDPLFSSFFWERIN